MKGSMSRVMRLKGSFYVMLVCCLAVFLVPGDACAGTGDNPFPSLTRFLQEYVQDPFKAAGWVKEVGEGRLLIEKGEVTLKQGEWLWVSKKQPELSPALQRPAAWIVVEALFPKTALARVARTPGGPVSPGDLVMTPPPPRIYVRGDAMRAGAAPVFEALVKDLVNAGFHVDMRAGGVVGTSAPNDLQLDLFRGEGNLVCRLSTAEDDRVLYYQTAADVSSAKAAVPAFAEGAADAGETAEGAARATETAKSGPTFLHSKPGRPVDSFRLDEPVSRVVCFQSGLGGGMELACLGKKDLLYYREKDGLLMQVSRVPYPQENVIPLHLHACDLDGDGGDELLVTLTRPVMTMDKQDNRLCSWVVSLRKGALETVAKDLPCYLRAIRDGDGNRVALAQEEGVYQQYEGPIYKLTWEAVEDFSGPKEVYEPAAGVYSLYQFNVVPQQEHRLVVLERGGFLHGYATPEERVVALGDRGVGDFHITAYPLKREQDLYVGGFDRRTYDDVYSARRFELRPDFDGQIFTLSKGRGGIIETFTEKVLSSRRAQDQVVAVKWIGERIEQTWESQKYEKDLLDFTFLKNPARILVLYKDADGYALEAFH